MLRMLALLAVVALASSCATKQQPPPMPMPAPAPAPAPASTAASAGAPLPPAEQQRRAQSEFPQYTPSASAPSVPVSPAAKAQAERLSKQAAEALDVGNEQKARADLDEALRNDPENALAKSLSSQMNVVNPVAHLGQESFRYTVKPGDTLSIIARQYLGDQNRFHILARYNDMKVPRGLKAGQVIRIPGKQRPPEEDPVPQRVAPIAKPAATPPPQPVEPPSSAPVAVAPPTPEPAATSVSPAEAKRQLVDVHYRRGAEAFTRQDLDTAISEWGRVLELEPNHPNATVRRQQAIALRDRIRQQQK
jgi:LysM repeat protein